MENRLSWLTLSTPVKPYKKPKSTLHIFAILNMGYYIAIGQLLAKPQQVQRNKA